MSSLSPVARLAALLILLLSMAWLSPTTAAAQDEPQVWVNTSSGVYHCPGTQYYGNTKRGKYLTESDATASGYRAAYGNRCSAAAPRAPRPVARQALAAQPDGNDAKVWVNSSSRVYHCPGTRYYGNTKSGRYMSEADATAAGNRPAHGARCTL